MGKIRLLNGARCAAFPVCWSLSLSLANRIGRCKLIIINLFSIINYLAPFGAHPSLLSLSHGAECGK
uniref:Putative secreted peptide n=1 Tax=Anopheles braziliensis TaxID=58242 RepID=A0A2M3ZWV6_9DIPT